MEIQSFYAMIYFIMFGLLLLTILTNFLIARGRLGYALRAIRDNEDAAEASGIFAPTCKVIAWAISAFITGLTGGVFAYWFSFIEPATVFDIMIAVKAFVMMMLGGAGTVLGPILGAFLLEVDLGNRMGTISNDSHAHPRDHRGRGRHLHPERASRPLSEKDLTGSAHQEYQEPVRMRIGWLF